MRTRIEKLYDEVKDYDKLTLRDNIEDRLNKVMLQYLDSLDSASDRVLGKKIRIVCKELSK